jgi:uncharacterized protein (TIGR00296 family)
MLSESEGKYLVKFAKEVVEKFVNGEKIEVPDKVPEKLKENSGAFVSLKERRELRGCIGYILPKFSLIVCVKEAAKSATRDPRFPPLTKEELKDVKVEVTVLTKPEKIYVEKPEDYLKKIKIGRDGLILKKAHHTGVLLPQVPVEQKWNVQEYLEGLSIKAGLDPDGWKSEGVEIYSFQGQIFGED